MLYVILILSNDNQVLYENVILLNFNVVAVVGVKVTIIVLARQSNSLFEDP